MKYPKAISDPSFPSLLAVGSGIHKAKQNRAIMDDHMRIPDMPLQCMVIL